MIYLEISWEEVKFFLVLVVVGVCYGYYTYRQGMRRGWDSAIYGLEDAGVIHVNDEGEVCRISDKEYKNIQRELEYQ